MTATRFFTFGGSTVATEIATEGSTTVPFFFLFGDYQGSAQLMMPDLRDASGDYDLHESAAHIQRNAYTPYGSQRALNTDTSDDSPTVTFDPALSIERGWLSQVADEATTSLGTGLTYLNARYYDPVASRFISPDPLLNPSDPRTFDAYGYASSNPVVFVDSSGLAPCSTVDVFMLEMQSPGVTAGACGTEGSRFFHIPGLPDGAVVRVPTAAGMGQFEHGVNRYANEAGGAIVHGLSKTGLIEQGAEAYSVGSETNPIKSLQKGWAAFGAPMWNSFTGALGGAKDAYLDGDMEELGHSGASAATTVVTVAVTIFTFVKAAMALPALVERAVARNLLAQAVAERDAQIAVLQAAEVERAVIGGYDVATGAVAVGVSSGTDAPLLFCAEMSCFRNLIAQGSKPENIRFTAPVHSATGPLQVCAKFCQPVFEPWQFPPGVKPAPDGRWLHNLVV